MSKNKSCFKIPKQDGTHLIVCLNEPFHKLKEKIYEMVELTKNSDVLRQVTLVSQKEVLFQVICS